MTTTHVGVYAIGSYLPPVVRGNDWWSSETLEAWRAKRLAKMMDGQRATRDADTEGVRMVLEAMARQGDDPFLGGKERRVFPDEMRTSDAQADAIRVALERAGERADRVDVLMESCNVPDVCVVPNAYAIHRQLGMSPSCLALSADATCNSFLVQLSLGVAMIARGDARLVVLSQCNALSRFSPADEPFSPWFGDGATAVVLGPVREGYGVLGQSHRTDSSLHLALRGGVTSRWHLGERVRLHSEDAAASRAVMTGSADRAREVVGEALARAKVPADDVTFYGNHPASVWFAEVTRRAAGLMHAKTVDSFTWTGNLGAANIPYSLEQGLARGELRDGALAAMCGGGAGMTYSGAVLRWGGR